MHYKGSISSGTSLDIYTDDGFWYDVISAYDSPISAGHRTMLVVYNNTNGNNLRISQSAYDLETSEIYMREGYKYNSSIIWGNWSLVTYPTAMRQYQTLSSLASALGAPKYKMSSDYTGDLNDLTTCCMVRCANTCLHNPIDGYIILEVIGENNGSEGNLIQRASEYLGRDEGIYERVKGDNGAWGDWIRIDNFGCSTPADLASLLGERVFEFNAEVYSNYNTGFDKAGIYILSDFFSGGIGVYLVSYDEVGLIYKSSRYVESEYTLTRDGAGDIIFSKSNQAPGSFIRMTSSTRI